MKCYQTEMTCGGDMRNSSAFLTVAAGNGHSPGHPRMQMGAVIILASSQRNA